MGDLSKHFSRGEFVCKCGCGADKVDITFLYKLEYARDRAGFNFHITSGCRCPSHNAKEGGKPDSDHITDITRSCEGADIAVANGYQRFKLVNAALDAGFTRVGVAKTFVHLGTRKKNPQNVLWIY
ncbi:D-Ala-D-Ala carboxypeptidase family metallohydrolase [Thermodesulfobacteriota bacterium]